MTAERCIIIDGDHPDLQYSGRIDFADPKAPVFLYAGNLVRARFTGASLAVRLAMSIDTGHPMWVGAIIDGGEMVSLRLEPGAAERSYLLASGLADGAHELILLRKSDFVSGNCRFCGLTLAPGQTLLPPTPRPTRTIRTAPTTTRGIATVSSSPGSWVRSCITTGSAGCRCSTATAMSAWRSGSASRRPMTSCSRSPDAAG